MVIGNHTKCKVIKNKVAAPFKIAEFDILYGKGISKESEILDLGIQLEIIEKSGSWFSYGGQRIGQGRDNVRIFLEQNPEIAAEVEAKIRAMQEQLDLDTPADFDGDDGEELN